MKTPNAKYSFSIYINETQFMFYCVQLQEYNNDFQNLYTKSPKDIFLKTFWQSPICNKFMDPLTKYLLHASEPVRTQTQY